MFFLKSMGIIFIITGLMTLSFMALAGINLDQSISQDSAPIILDTRELEGSP